MELRLASIMVLLALLGGAALAVEEEPVPVAGAAPQIPATAPPPEPAATPAAAPTTSFTSPDTFVPSEEISEDLSVSFPVDI